MVARDEGLLPSAAPDGGITFNEWADWFLENRSKPPFRSEQTHLNNLGALKFLGLGSARTDYRTSQWKISKRI